jgi:hypothetical protein
MAHSEFLTRRFPFHHALEELRLLIVCPWIIQQALVLW